MVSVSLEEDRICIKKEGKSVKYETMIEIKDEKGNKKIVKAPPLDLNKILIKDKK